MQKTFFASKGRNFFTKTQLRRAPGRRRNSGASGGATAGKTHLGDRIAHGIPERPRRRRKPRGPLRMHRRDLFVTLRPAEPTHYNDCRRHAADGPAGRGLPSAKAGSAKRFCGMPIRKCGLVRRRSAALPGSHGRSAPKTPEASGASPTASDGYAERSCGELRF